MDRPVCLHKCDTCVQGFTSRTHLQRHLHSNKCILAQHRKLRCNISKGKDTRKDPQPAPPKETRTSVRRQARKGCSLFIQEERKRQDMSRRKGQEPEATTMEELSALWDEMDEDTKRAWGLKALSLSKRTLAEKQARVLKTAVNQCKTMADSLKAVGVQMVTLVRHEQELDTISNLNCRFPKSFLGYFEELCGDAVAWPDTEEMERSRESLDDAPDPPCYTSDTHAIAQVDTEATEEEDEGDNAAFHDISRTRIKVEHDAELEDATPVSLWANTSDICPSPKLKRKADESLHGGPSRKHSNKAGPSVAAQEPRKEDSKAEETQNSSTKAPPTAAQPGKQDPQVEEIEHSSGSKAGPVAAQQETDDLDAPEYSDSTIDQPWPLEDSDHQEPERSAPAAAAAPPQHLQMLGEVKDMLLALNQRMKKEEIGDKVTHISRGLSLLPEPMTTKEQVDALDVLMADSENKRGVVELLSSAGGANPNRLTCNIMYRLMDSEAQKHFNIRGTGLKVSFRNYLLYNIVFEAVLLAFPTAQNLESKVRASIGLVLRSAVSILNKRKNRAQDHAKNANPAANV